MDEVHEDKQRLCDRCHYNEADGDEPIPERFQRYLHAVCNECSCALRRNDEAMRDREETRND